MLKYGLWQGELDSPAACPTNREDLPGSIHYGKNVHDSQAIVTVGRA
jgi:hypothetical protein